MASQKFDPKAATDTTDQASENDAPAELTSAYAGAQYVPMPAGGLRALARAHWPADADNPEAMQQHVTDLLVLNSDSLRNEDSYTAGQQVRIS